MLQKRTNKTLSVVLQDKFTTHSVILILSANTTIIPMLPPSSYSLLLVSLFISWVLMGAREQQGLLFYSILGPLYFPLIKPKLSTLTFHLSFLPFLNQNNITLSRYSLSLSTPIFPCVSQCQSN